MVRAAPSGLRFWLTVDQRTNDTLSVSAVCETCCSNTCCEALWLNCNRISFNRSKNTTQSPPIHRRQRHFVLTRSRPNQIADPGPKSGPARKSESRGPENGVSRWRRPNSDIYSQNHHFGLVYDMIYQFLGMEAKNYKFGIFCQQCHPSLASGDADIRPRNASRIHTCHLFTS